MHGRYTPSCRSALRCMLLQAIHYTAQPAYRVACLVLVLPPHVTHTHHTHAQSAGSTLFASHPKEACELLLTSACDGVVRLWDVRAMSRWQAGGGGGRAGRDQGTAPALPVPGSTNCIGSKCCLHSITSILASHLSLMNYCVAWTTGVCVHSVATRTAR
jgi:hypothetical protein